jgi:hypothetical protein
MFPVFPHPKQLNLFDSVFTPNEGLESSCSGNGQFVFSQLFDDWEKSELYSDSIYSSI